MALPMLAGRELRRAARELERKNALVASIVSGLVSQTIGRGFEPRAISQSPEFNALL